MRTHRAIAPRTFRGTIASTTFWMLTAWTLLSTLTTEAAAQSLLPNGFVNSDNDRLLAPPRQWAFVAYPLELLTYATIDAPQLSFEVWVDLADGFALNIQPRGIWYPPAGERTTHGGGVGGALGFYYFTDRSLSGPFYGLYAGDVEAFFSTGRGRVYGATAVFGYAIGFDNGGLLTFSLGLGYWHRAGVLDTGTQWPEIFSLRIGTGYAGGSGNFWGSAGNDSTSNGSVP